MRLRLDINPGSFMARTFFLFTKLSAPKIENVGVEPDHRVGITTKDWSNGHDPQLEKAVSHFRRKLRKVENARNKNPGIRFIQSKKTNVHISTKCRETKTRIVRS